MLHCPPLYIFDSLFLLLSTPTAFTHLRLSVPLQMKALLFLLFLFSCFASDTETVSDASLLDVERARSSRAISFSKDFPLDGRKFKVLNGPERKLDQKRKGTHVEGDDEELIYNVDYHGVSTHPSPSPKHPKPKH